MPKRLDKNLKRSLRSMPLERITEEDKRKFTPEQRLKRLWAYLDRHAVISTRIYVGLNHCSKYQALKDLKEEVTAGRLKAVGDRSTRMYMKN